MILNSSTEHGGDEDGLCNSWRRSESTFPATSAAVVVRSAINDRHAIISPPDTAIAQGLKRLNVHLVLLQSQTISEKRRGPTTVAAG